MFSLPNFHKKFENIQENQKILANIFTHFFQDDPQNVTNAIIVKNLTIFLTPQTCTL